MAAVTTPTVRGRRLAKELRRLRERANLKAVDASRRLGWYRGKLSRIEDAITRPTRDEVIELLQLYGVDPDRHDAILHLTEDSWQRGWWTAYQDVFAGNYVMLEDQAPRIRSFEPQVIPGLLQTPDYARTLIRRVRLVEGDELDELVAARMHRKTIMSREEPPELHYVIGEAAFRQVIGDEDLMYEQISQVVDYVIRHPNLTVQVLPFSVGEPLGLEGAYTIFEFPQDDGLDVGHTESMLGEWYAESADQITRIRVAFARVSEAAMPPEASKEWLTDLLNR